jgi:hypothetical protein
MGLLSRLYNFYQDYLGNLPIDDTKVDAELNQLISGHNDQENRLAAVEGSFLKKDGSVDMTGPLKWTESGDEYIRIPRLTTAQRDLLTPTASMVIYNTTIGRIQGYNGYHWIDLLWQNRSLKKITAATYSIDENDDIVLIDATSNNVTITLQLVANRNGRTLHFKRIDNSGFTVTIQRSGSDTVDGSTSITLAAYVNKYLVAVVVDTMWRSFS